MNKISLGLITVALSFGMSITPALASPTPWSDLTAPASNTSLLMGANKTVFTWTGLGAGSGLDLAANSTNAAGNTQTVLNVLTGGANSTAAQTTYGVWFANTHTGVSATNVAAYFTASGGANNYAAIFNGGNVGIGTVTPTTALTVNGAITVAAGTSTVPSLASITDPTTGIFFSGSSRTIRFASNGVERMRLTGDGSLGIGNSLDFTFFPLDIRKSQNAPLSMHITNQSSGSLAETTVGLMNDSSSGDTASELFLNSTTNTNYGGINSLNLYNYTNNGNLTFGTNFSERIRITSSGNVGIGTTTPRAILDVVSTTSGFLPPRVTQKQRTVSITTPVEGMIIYNLSEHKLNVYTGTKWEVVTSQ